MKLSEIYKILGLEFSGEELEITALNSLSKAGASLATAIAKKTLNLSRAQRRARF